MSDPLRDVWVLVHEWRYTGKIANASDEEIYRDSMADVLERAIESSQVVPLSRYNHVVMELEASESKSAKVASNAKELLDMCIVSFVRIAHHPSVTWNHPSVESVAEIARNALEKLKGCDTP